MPWSWNSLSVKPTGWGLCNVYPIGAITKGQQDGELTDMAELKASGCLAFSDDGKSVLNSRLFRLAMEYAKMLDVLIIEHCQDPLLSAGGVMNEGVVSTRLGLKGDPGIAETVTVARDIEIAHYLNARVHLAHMSLKRSCELIRFAKSQGIKVTAEACPHHFVLTDEACSSFDTFDQGQSAAAFQRGCGGDQGSHCRRYH